MKKILLIEDDVSVVSFIKKGLTEENFEVSVAFDGESGRQMVAGQTFDLIILDVMLPDQNGIDLCRLLRSQGHQVPILFLTALNTSDNIALGLNSGADDYLAKPFKFIELVARVNALLRRTGGQDVVSQLKTNRFTIGDLKVDDDTKTVERGGTVISLTATEYRLLLTLLRNKGKVLSRTELLENVWDINFSLTTNVVDVYINYLRKKIDVNHKDKLLHTVIGMGYVLKEA